MTISHTYTRTSEEDVSQRTETHTVQAVNIQKELSDWFRNELLDCVDPLKDRARIEPTAEGVAERLENWVFSADEVPVGTYVPIQKAVQLAKLLERLDRHADEAFGGLANLQRQLDKLNDKDEA